MFHRRCMCLLQLLGLHKRKNVSQTWNYVGFKTSRSVILLDANNAQALGGRLQRSCGACRWEAWCQHEFRVGGAQTQGKSFFQSQTYNSIDRNTARRGMYLPPRVWADGISLVTRCSSFMDTWQFLKVNYEAISTYKKRDINCFHGFTPSIPSNLLFILPSLMTLFTLLKLKIF